jgi:hypothetical protein
MVAAAAIRATAPATISVIRRPPTSPPLSV